MYIYILSYNLIYAYAHTNEQKQIHHMLQQKGSIKSIYASQRRSRRNRLMAGEKTVFFSGVMVTTVSAIDQL